MNLIRYTAISLLILALGGCGSEVLAPSGDVAVKLRDVLGITTALTLVIVLPVMVAIVWFAIYYRSSNKQSEDDYDPEFSHSVQLELLIWAAPLTIIIWLGALTWVSTHKLDPYRPLDTETRGVTEGATPLVVQTISMDWKWLFIYPEYGIATVNELAAPLDRPIRFDLTSTEVMNAFYVPTLAGMIYTMAGMQTQLHAVINEPGEYKGMSSHYSGAGFSGMNFPFHGLDQDGFDAWVAKVRDTGQVLDRDSYRELLKPSENVPATYYRLDDATLYHDILNRCVEPGQVCMDETMAGHGDGHSEGHGGDQPHGTGGAAAHDGEAAPATDHAATDHAGSGHAGAGHAGAAEAPASGEPHWGEGGAAATGGGEDHSMHGTGSASENSAPAAN